MAGAPPVTAGPKAVPATERLRVGPAEVLTGAQLPRDACDQGFSPTCRPRRSESPLRHRPRGLHPDRAVTTTGQTAGSVTRPP